MFSIVIPLYNKEKWVVECVNSVLRQSFIHFECIIIDDGSTDNSIQLIKDHFTDNRIRLVRQDNAGVSAARNTGISQAKYEYIAFMDADDYWHPDYLKLNHEVLAKNAQIDIISSNYINKEPVKHSFENQKELKADVVFIDNYFKNAHRDLVFWTSATIVKKTALNQTGVFDTRLKSGEDLDLWFRLVIHGKAAHILNTIAFYRLTEIEEENIFKLPDISQHLVTYLVEKTRAYFSGPDKVPYLEPFVYTFLLNYLFLFYFASAQYNEAWQIYSTIPLQYRLRKPRHWLYLLPRPIGRFIFQKVFFRRNQNISPEYAE